MYLDLFDELRLNKRLIKLAGFEVAAYWAELTSVLKQVVKKQTADELGFFNLDRNFIERETTLTLAKQLKCDEQLVRAGVMAKDAENPNRVTISVSAMIELITDEDNTKLKKSTRASKEEQKLAKISGMKNNFKKAISETDLELRESYCRWVEALVDACQSGTAKYNCSLTKAAVELFIKDINAAFSNKADKLKAIELATINCWKNANWAVERLQGGTYRQNSANKLPEQRIATAVSTDLAF